MPGLVTIIAFYCLVDFFSTLARLLPLFLHILFSIRIFILVNHFLWIVFRRFFGFLPARTI